MDSHFSAEPSELLYASYKINMQSISCAPGSEEFILPDFGEGFGNSDGMLLDMRVGASPLS